MRARHDGAATPRAAAHLADRAREPLHALVQLRRVEQREGEPERGLAPALGRDRVARRERHAVARRLGVERALVERADERHPHVVAAVRRIGLVLARHVALEGREQRVAPLAVEGLGVLHVPVVRAGREPACGDVLDQRRRVEVALELQHRDPLAHGTARGHPAGAEPAADDLRQRVHVDHVRRRERRGSRGAARRRSSRRRRRGPPARRSCAPSRARRAAAGAPRTCRVRWGSGRRSGRPRASPRGARAGARAARRRSRPRPRAPRSRARRSGGANPASRRTWATPPPPRRPARASRAR